MSGSVTVKLAKNDCRVIDISTATSVFDVKILISQISGLDPLCFDLLFSGKILNPDSTLKELSLGASSVLHLYSTPNRSKEQAQSSSTQITVKKNGKTGQSGNTRYQYYVYCNICNGLQPGKLRVRCCICSEGALILDKEPCGWDDVLIPHRLCAQCTICDRNTAAQFYFKCCNHDGEEEFVALKHVRPNRRHVECVTCATESSPVLVFPGADKHVMCIECFVLYCQVSLDQRSFIEDTDIGYSLPCPAGCEDSLIEDVHHFKLLGKEQYERYKHFAAEECVLKSGGLLCPNTGCGEGIIIEDESKVVQCRTCLLEFCRECRLESHHGPCQGASSPSQANLGLNVDAEQALRARWDTQSMETIQHTTKSCPQCRVKTEKSGGCMHMKCSRCQNEWCWLCEKEWDRTCQGDHWFG